MLKFPAHCSSCMNHYTHFCLCLFFHLFICASIPLCKLCTSWPEWASSQSWWVVQTHHHCSLMLWPAKVPPPWHLSPFPVFSPCLTHSTAFLTSLTCTNFVLYGLYFLCIVFVLLLFFFTKKLKFRWSDIPHYNYCTLFSLLLLLTWYFSFHILEVNKWITSRS